MTTTQVTQVPNSFYVELLDDVDPAAVMFAQGDERVTAAQLQDALSQGTELGFVYAQSVLYEMQTLLLSAFKRKAVEATREAVIDHPKAAVIAMFRQLLAKEVIWQTFSHGYTAGELADLFQGDDTAAVGYVNGLFRIARDLLNFRANPDEADDWPALA